jgi:putative nucleotidyltransferase with HDIG domain
MKFETTFLRSRVARRIFVLFICCALLPIGALAILSFSQVEKKLNELGQRRLNHANKAVSMAILERLVVLGDGMKMVASKYRTDSSHILAPPAAEFGEHLKESFKCLAIITGKGEVIPLFGHIQNIPKLTPKQNQHIRSGGTLVSIECYPDLTLEIFMATALDSKNHGRGLLLGRLDPAYLWVTSAENLLLPMTELCILDQSNHVLFSSFPGPVSFPEQAMLQMSRSALGEFEWVHEKKKYIAEYRSISLQGSLLTPKWTVILSESKSNALAPAANFKKIFLLVFLLSLWVVLFLSIVQIRRSLIPLEKLQQGTRRIAKQDFNSPVTIKSGDEFEELATSFNTMASRLGKQFNALTTMGEIDRAILSALDTEKIVDVVLAGIRDVLLCDCVGVTLLDYSDRIIARTYTGGGKPDMEKVVETIHLSAAETQELEGHAKSLLIELGGAAPDYLASMIRKGMKTSLILPIILKNKLSGFITLGWYDKPALHIQEDLDRARQLADQMGVALSNAGLVRELNELNWGTLEALARAIDAKSPWTAGHSERVTKLGLKIGRSLGLTQEEMDTLHRAGLLHDIGKLGIPVDILDKEGKLTKEEERLMREHVRLGVRILEPIAAYAEVVPIVLHHHEYFNGEGYPSGLAGEAICLGGRIFAVADSFDALTSNRPYRQALSRAYAIEMIKQWCGSQYDPDIVRAFLEVMAEESREGEA